MRQLTLEIILRVVFGVSGEEADRAARRNRGHARGRVRSMRRMLVDGSWSSATSVRAALGVRFRIAVERFDALLLDLLARRRVRLGDDSVLAGRAAGDDSVLATLLEQRDQDGNPPSDRQLRDELVALLVGGHDSSAASLAWAFERLARHPAVQARMREGDPAYADAVVKEVLRARPALTIAPRLCCASRSGSPAGTYRPESRSQLACGWRCDARICGRDASAFEPERWLDDGPRRTQCRGSRSVGACDAARARRSRRWRCARCLRAAAPLRLAPAGPESERARRSMLVVVPDSRRRSGGWLTGQRAISTLQPVASISDTTVRSAV